MTKTMYDGVNGTEYTTLASNITNVDTSMTVIDSSVLPSASNILIIYKVDSEEKITNWERVPYSAIVTNTIAIARSGDEHASSDSNNPLNFETGDRVARFISNWDHAAFKENISELQVSVAANELDISNNAANIATNTSDISDHIADLANPHEVTSTQVGLGNVTNDAQLKRSANDFSSFIEKTTPVDADKILIEDSEAAGVKKYIQISNLPSGGGTEVWNEITDYTPTPASTSTITTTSDLTGVIALRSPLRYVIGGTTYYAIVTDMSSNLITIAGAPLSGSITALHYGDYARVLTEPIPVPGYYATSSDTTLIENDLFMPFGFVWTNGTAHIVMLKYMHAVNDGGATQPQVNLTIAGSDLLTSDVTVGTSQVDTVVNINPLNYDVNYGESIEIDVTAGTNGDAHDLTIYYVAVYP